MSTSPAKPLRRLRSFVRRDGRRTPAQDRAFTELCPKWGLPIDSGLIEIQKVFGNDNPTFLEIGFGTGQSLLAAAKAQSHHNFIGVETHKPGLGSLLLGLELNELTNLRAFYGDVIDVLEKCIPNESLDGVQIFFPDPWQKRRHHARRLIQPEFIRTILTKLKTNATLHLATDWDDYATHMMKVLSQETKLTNLAGNGQFSERSPYRPVLSKFERRAEREGRHIYDLQFFKS